MGEVGSRAVTSGFGIEKSNIVQYILYINITILKFI